jgi:hypothetical protein
LHWLDDAPNNNRNVQREFKNASEVEINGGEK